MARPCRGDGIAVESSTFWFEATTHGAVELLDPETAPGPTHPPGVTFQRVSRSAILAVVSVIDIEARVMDGNSHVVI